MKGLVRQFSIFNFQFSICNPYTAMILPAYPPSAARLIVCEAAVRAGRLRANWPRRASGVGMPFRGGLGRLEAKPPAFVIVEAARENLDDLLRRMAWSRRIFPWVEWPWWPSGTWPLSSGSCAGGGRPFSHVAAAACAADRPGGPSSGHCAAAFANHGPRIWASLPWGPPGT